jgi:hypothetical protein
VNCGDVLLPGVFEDRDVKVRGFFRLLVSVPSVRRRSLELRKHTGHPKAHVFLMKGLVVFCSNRLEANYIVVGIPLVIERRVIHYLEI